MEVGSLFYFVFIFIALAFFSLKNFFSVQTRLAIINAVFLGSIFNSIESALPLFSFAVLSYSIVAFVARNRKRFVLLAAIAFIVFIFAIVKKYAIVEDIYVFGFSYTTIGLSYLLFRIIHMLIDVYEETLDQAPSGRDYFNYLFFFLSFTSGPVHSYEAFQKDVIQSTPIVDKDKIMQALSRIVLGLIKVFIVAVVAHQMTTMLPLSFESASGSGVFGGLEGGIHSLFSHAETGESLLRLVIRYLLHCFAFLFYLYYNFSGYMDIIVGLGVLFGFKIPENFNKPFEAHNFLDFWSHWHMTLSNWFKTYLFNPLLKSLAANFGKNIPIKYLAPIAFFITFFVMGVWHGTTEIYVIYGLLFGAGVSLNMLYQTIMAKLITKKKYKALCKNYMYKNTCRAFMISFFAICLSCMWLNAQEFLQFANMLALLGIIKLWCVAALAVFLVMAMWETFVNLFAHLPKFINFIFYGIGFISLIIVWSKNYEMTEFIKSIIGFALPSEFLAVAALAIILFAWTSFEKSDHQAKLRERTSLISVQFLLFMMTVLMNTGAVPDFIYEGF